MESRRGLENVIISNGKIVNVVLSSYEYILNQLFFKKAEEILTDAQLSLHKRTINKNDRSSITDFIINDKSQFSVKKRGFNIFENSHFKIQILNFFISYKEGVPKAHCAFEFDSVS
jgi:hypothetical protein